MLTQRLDRWKIDTIKGDSTMKTYKFVAKLNTEVSSEEKHDECYEGTNIQFRDGDIEVDAWIPENEYAYGIAMLIDRLKDILFDLTYPYPDEDEL